MNSKWKEPVILWAFWSHLIHEEKRIIKKIQKHDTEGMDFQYLTNKEKLSVFLDAGHFFLYDQKTDFMLLIMYLFTIMKVKYICCCFFI